MTIDELERQLSYLRRELAETEAKLPEVEAELGPANQALEAAQAVYDELGRERARAQHAVGETWDPAYEGQTWSPRSQQQAEQNRETAQMVEREWTVAREELETALVNRNTIDKRRSDLGMHIRATRARIEQLEAQLARAREDAERAGRERSGVLQRIRERLG